MKTANSVNPMPLPRPSLARWFALATLATATAFAQQTPASTSAESPIVTSEEVITLPEFTVTSEADQGYVVADAISGSRAGTKIVETPFSVQSLTNEFMNDFQLFEMADQLRFIAGAFSGAEDTGTNNGKTLRGFSPPVLRDGFSGANPPNRSTVDRVEVIRGPVSALYGASGPGGLINYVSKRGKRKPAYTATGTFSGDYGFKRYSFEATGPVIKDKLFYYGIYTHDYTESDLEYFFNKKDLYAAGFTYQLSKNTSITISWEKQTITSNQGDTIPILQVTTPAPTRSVGIYWDLATYNIMGPYNILERDFESGNVLVEHRFTDQLIGRFNLQTYDKDFVENQYRYGSGNALVENGTMTAEAFRQDQDSGANLAQADLRYNFITGSVKHTLLFAGDATLDNRVRNITYVAPPVNMLVGTTTVFRRPTYVINPFAPVWPQIPDSAITQVFQDSDRSVNNYGAFFGHRMFLMKDKLITLAGLRYDRVENEKLKTLAATAVVSANNMTPVVTTNDGSGSSEESLTYTLGANYKIRGDGLVAFVNHSTGFEPTVSIDAGTLGVVPNESSRGIDAGFKGSLFNDSLLWTASIFEITKEDVAISNPEYNTAALPGTPQFILGGEEHAKGYELDFRWNVNKNFYFQAGGSFIDAVVTEPVASRDRMAKAPRYSGYAATRYVFREGILDGWRVGASLSYTGDYLYNRGTVNANGIQTRFRQIHPAVTLYNAFVGYNFRTGKKWRHSVQVNMQNITDEYYLQDTFRLARGRETRLTYTIAY
ncbi:TonB-dependent siderophore receptor [Oleiharenicola lentus]|uniref:TonB-dependent siderophore receptor n=1 Tax=Oleiharenicola lentus TaxID=2508720 RepID=UPI003F670181